MKKYLVLKVKKISNYLSRLHFMYNCLNFRVSNFLEHLGNTYNVIKEDSLVNQGTS